MSVPAMRRRPGPRRALSEDEILDAAMSLLDDGGPDAASVRGIAARVGVAPNAVYTYFPDKAAVVGALVERLLGEVDHDVFADRERPWRERVEALALELRAKLSAHPGAVSLMVGGPLGGPNALALNERLLELLADAGLDSADAARASYLLVVHVFGSMALEVADVHQAGPLPPESDRIAARARAFSATPADDFPRRAAAAATVAGFISTEQYLWGLRRILDGITPRVANAAASAGGVGLPIGPASQDRTAPRPALPAALSTQ
jgi:TetR/AcrR family tetracycline transcriptional repressor